MKVETIRVIGLGAMHWPMVGHLHRAGHSVLGVDVDEACRAGSARDHGKRELGAPPARRGIGTADAGVSGTAAGVQSANPVFMVSGETRPSSASARSSDCLASACSGSARPVPATLKAMDNLVPTTGFAAACEAVIVGQRAEFDPAAMIEVFNAPAGCDFSAGESIGNIVARTCDTDVPLGLFASDVKIAADLAEAETCPAPISGKVSDGWRRHAMRPAASTTAPPPTPTGMRSATDRDGPRGTTPAGPPQATHRVPGPHPSRGSILSWQNRRTAGT